MKYVSGHSPIAIQANVSRVCLLSLTVLVSTGCESGPGLSGGFGSFSQDQAEEQVVSPLPGNQPPTILSASLNTAGPYYRGQPVGITVTASDDGGTSNLTYSCDTCSYTGGVLTVTLPDIIGSYAFVITATDADGLTAQSNPISLTIMNRMPVVNWDPILPVSLPRGQTSPTPFSVYSSDPDGDTVSVTFSLVGPSLGTIDASTGSFTAGGSIGSTVIRATGDDGRGGIVFIDRDLYISPAWSQTRMMSDNLKPGNHIGLARGDSKLFVAYADSAGKIQLSVHNEVSLIRETTVNIATIGVMPDVAIIPGLNNPVVVYVNPNDSNRLKLARYNITTTDLTFFSFGGAGAPTGVFDPRIVIGPDNSAYITYFQGGSQKLVQTSPLTGASPLTTGELSSISAMSAPPSLKWSFSNSAPVLAFQSGAGVTVRDSFGNITSLGPTTNMPALAVDNGNVFAGFFENSSPSGCSGLSVVEKNGSAWADIGQRCFAGSQAGDSPGFINLEMALAPTIFFERNVLGTPQIRVRSWVGNAWLSITGPGPTVANDSQLVTVSDGVKVWAAFRANGGNQLVLSLLD